MSTWNKTLSDQHYLKHSALVYLNENTALTQRGCQCWGLLGKKMQSTPATNLNFAQSLLRWPVKHPPELWNNRNGEFTGTKVQMIQNKLFWHLINLQSHRSVSKTKYLNETMRHAVLNHVAVFGLNHFPICTEVGHVSKKVKQG